MPPPDRFEYIAPSYDLNNLVLSGGFVLYWDRQLKRALLEALCRHRTKNSPGLILDLGCGTLRLARGLLRLRPDLRLMGFDPSLAMLKKGLIRLPPAAPGSILVAKAEAMALPLPDNSLDVVVSQFVWRNLDSRRSALTEIRRVLRPGGRLLIMELGFNRKRIWGGLYNAYLSRVLPRLGRLLSSRRADYDYLARSIINFPPPEAIAREMGEAGFMELAWRPLTSGIVWLYAGTKPVV